MSRGVLSSGALACEYDNSLLIVTTATSSTVRVALWYAVVFGTLLLFPLAVLGKPLWQLSKRELLAYALLWAAFAVSALVHVLMVRREPASRRVVASLVITAAAFAFALIGIFAMGGKVSRIVVLGSFAIALALMPIPLLSQRARVLGTVAVVGLALSFVAVGARRHLWNGPTTGDKNASTATLTTTFYNVEVKSFAGYVPLPAVRGGGVTVVNNDVLLGTGDGYLYQLEPEAADFKVRKLPARVPLNGEAFATAVGGKYIDPINTGDSATRLGTAVQTWRFRTADVFTQPLENGVRIYASHHFWHNTDRCYTVRVSTLDTPWPMPEDFGGQWHTLYETTPCLPLVGEKAKSGRQPFQGEDVGGRMALLDANTLLLTTGEHGLSGLESSFIPAQDPEAHYGKTIAIDLTSHTARVYSLGHRNPQGLFIDKSGTVWQTEHAARGGDELNIIRANANYGWPRVTYGTEYAQFVWPMNQQQGRHEGYQKPLYSWVPSIGISSVIGLDGDRFSIWKGDLLIGSLATRALYRVKVDEERVVVVEPIAIEQRVRDLAELPDGRILVWADGGLLQTLSPSAEAGGALAFGLQCGTCHTVRDGLSHRVGPDLLGIVGKDIAGTSFRAYSPALTQHEGTWTRDNLDAFIKNPHAFAPGTTMAFQGITDQATRDQVLDYLETLTQPD